MEKLLDTAGNGKRLGLIAVHDCGCGVAKDGGLKVRLFGFRSLKDWMPRRSEGHWWVERHGDGGSLQKIERLGLFRMRGCERNGANNGATNVYW